MSRTRASSKQTDDADQAPASISIAASTQLIRAPLTRRNLFILEQENSPHSYSEVTIAIIASEPDSCQSSLSRAAPACAVDDERKLGAYNVNIDIHHRLPDQLQQHLHDVILAERDKTSPTAKRIVKNQRTTATLSEQAAIDVLFKDMLFKSELEGGEPLINTLPKLNLSRMYLPNAKPYIRRDLGPLSQPQPDITLGYITWKDATTVGSQTVFNQAEESIFTRESITHSLHFPFLTSQWKSQRTGSHIEARAQSARDGAAIVNYLHTFYQMAGQKAPSAVDTCHFSLTCDTSTAQLWIHWREDEGDSVRHYMEKIGQAFLDAENTIYGTVRLRMILRNILEYSVGPRLQTIKDAIPMVQLLKTAATKSKPPSSKQPNSTLKRSLANASDCGSAFANPPILLSPSPSEREGSARKRPRTDM